MKITSNFDSGNIKVVKAADPLNIQLEINKDHQSDFFSVVSLSSRNNAISKPQTAY